VKAANGYRKYAEECLRWACDAGSDEERKAFLDMARTWTQAAAQHDSAFAPVLNANMTADEKNRARSSRSRQATIHSRDCCLK
jgi:hypothetical protein